MLLRRLLTEEGGERQRLKAELITVLDDPRELLSCGILDEEHLLYRNALAVEDALEAVTNGMENPTVLERLHEVPDESLVGPWKQAVLAIKALYDGDREALDSALEIIPAESPPRRLAELVRSLIADGREAGSFARKLLRTPDFVVSAGEQMEEALEMEMDDLFCDTAAMLIRDLGRDYPEYAPEFAVWCFRRLADRDFSLLPLIKRFRPVFGGGETLRLAAIGVAAEDADASLFYWLKFIIASLQESRLEAGELGSALLIAAELAEQGSVPYEPEEREQEEPGEDELLLIEQIGKLLARISEEIAARHPTSAVRLLTTPRDCRAVAAGFGAEDRTAPLPFRSLEQLDRDERRGRAPETEGEREPMQLELFA